MREGKNFAAIGIGVNFNVDQGINFFNKFGKFDELMVGRKWFNIGVLKYIWKYFPGQAVTPQVIVMERLITDANSYSIETEKELLREYGNDNIKKISESNF
ncbi:MAG TPA: hypothetical protein PLO56_02225 [Rhodothermales bacterium]|nr:hypothetical protein [Rhodothermales bacterium]